VGQVVASLKDLGLYKDCQLVLVSDHGESLEQGVFGLHAPIIRQATLHVPMVLSGAGVPAGRVVEEVVELIDLFPTLLESFGLSPHVSQGTSLWPLIREQEVEWDERAFSILPNKFYGNMKGVEDIGVAVQTRNWKLVHFGGESPRLHDLRVDPQELNDLAATEVRIAESLKRSLEQWFSGLKLAGPGADVSPETLEILEQLGYVQDDKDDQAR